MRVMTAVIFALLPAASSAAEPSCGALSLVGGEKAIAVVDNPPPGKSIGDVRAGSRKLLDQSGKPVGEVHYVATLTGPGAPGGDVLSGQYTIRLPEGWIASQTVYQLPDSGDTSQRAGNAILIVTGGTGPYAGATGTIEIVAGEAPLYVFDLSCP